MAGNETIEELTKILTAQQTTLAELSQNIVKEDQYSQEICVAIKASEATVAAKEAQICAIKKELAETQEKYSTKRLTGEINNLQPQVAKLSEKISTLIASIQRLTEVEQEKQKTKLTHRDLQLVDYRQNLKKTTPKCERVVQQLNELHELQLQSDTVLPKAVTDATMETDECQAVIQTEIASIRKNKELHDVSVKTLKKLRARKTKVQKEINETEKKIRLIEAYYEYAQRCLQFIIDQLVEKQLYPDDLSQNHHANWKDYMIDHEIQRLGTDEDSDDDDDSDDNTDDDEDFDNDNDNDNDSGDDEDTPPIIPEDISKALEDYNTKQIIRLAHRIHFNNLWVVYREKNVAHSYCGDEYSLWHEDLDDYINDVSDDKESIFVLSNEYDRDNDPEDHPDFGHNDSSHYGHITRYYHAIHIRTLMAMDKPPEDLTNPSYDEFHLGTTDLDHGFIDYISTWRYT